MKYTLIVWLAVTVCIGLQTAGTANALGKEVPQKPNILFIFADDLGWGDLGCYGNKRVKTPNIDKLATQGTLFTQFYVNGSVCSPSRTAFMTGHFPARHRVHGHFDPRLNQKRDMPDWLDADVTTVTDLLQKQGYTTAHFGKWHLGSGPGEPGAAAYGLDVRKIDTDPDEVNEMSIWKPEARPTSSKTVVDHTLDFISKNAGKPFYINTWFADPHATLNPSEEQMEPYRGMGPGKKIPHRSTWEIYYATVTEMDKQVGRLLEGLQQKGLADNTIVVFSSDNGPEEIEIFNASHSGVGSAGPLRGRKRSLYDGGVRVPFIVRWPGSVPAGKVNTQSVVTAVDFLPTVAQLAGAKVPPDVKPDGEDVSDILLGQNRVRTRPIMWEWRYRIFGHIWNQSPMLAIRDGNWKLLLNPDRSRVELYDMTRDPSEVNNVAAQNGKVVDKMAATVLAWQQTLPKGFVEETAGENNYPWPGKTP